MHGEGFRMILDRLTILGLVAWVGSIGLAAPAPGIDDKPAEKSTAPAGFEVETHKDIAYRTDKEADKERHRLDVYCPKGQKDFPVVLFVHGGSWNSGNKNLYTFYGETFAKSGIGFVICNYRLSPEVQHPTHIQDVAKAFAWTRENIGKYGGKAGNLFVCGHSAGGHLVSLLATDPEYLKAEKRSPADIKGVVSISGVYQIYAKERVFNAPFGKDEEVCKNASPLTHVVGKHPPFLIAYGENDIPHLDEMAKDMHAALKKVDSPSDLLLCKRRNHVTIMITFIDPDDTLNKAFREFVLGKGK
jgi:acetyl esterase/lipase